MHSAPEEQKVASTEAAHALQIKYVPLQNVINHFTRIGQDERVRFLGNVNVASDIQLTELRSFYSAVSALF
jgi:hypothetical protein